MSVEGRTTQKWIGVSETLLVHAMLFAILFWTIWESWTDLSPRDRTLPLGIAVIVTVVLLYNLASRLWFRRDAQEQAPATAEEVEHTQEDPEASTASDATDTYGNLARERLSVRHAYAIGAFVAYVFLTPFLSIYLATAGFVVVLSLLLRVPPIGAAIGLVFALAIPALFQFGMEMHLP